MFLYNKHSKKLIANDNMKQKCDRIYLKFVSYLTQFGTKKLLIIPIDINMNELEV